MGHTDPPQPQCHQCGRPAEHTIVYGCYQQHINDTQTCTQHTNELTTILDREKLRRANQETPHTCCQICGERIDEYLTRPINNTTTETNLNSKIITPEEVIHQLNEALNETLNQQ
jgi:hypothetical protein